LETRKLEIAPAAIFQLFTVISSVIVGAESATKE